MSQQNSQTIHTYNKSIEPYVNRDMTRSREGFYNDWLGDIFRDVPQNARILEIGSAHGRDARYLASKGYKVQVTDASGGFLDYLRQHGHSPLRLDIIAEAPEGKWDVVYASAVFLHFTDEDFSSALQNIHAALVKDGKFAFSVIERDGELTEDQPLGLPRYFRYFQADELRAKLERANFLVTDIRETIYKDKNWLYVMAEKKEK